MLYRICLHPALVHLYNIDVQYLKDSEFVNIQTTIVDTQDPKYCNARLLFAFIGMGTPQVDLTCLPLESCCHTQYFANHTG